MSSPSGHAVAPPSSPPHSAPGGPRRRFVTWASAVALLVVSAVVTIPFTPRAHGVTQSWFLEAFLSSSVAGSVQVYFDHGEGFSEAGSAKQTVPAGDDPQLYRFPMPARAYVGIRLDPLDRAGRLILHRPLRVLSSDGHVVRVVPLSALRAHQEIASVRDSNGACVITTTIDATDPQVFIELSPPLALPGLLAVAVKEVLPRAVVVFAALLILLLLLERTPRVQQTIATAYRCLRPRPARTVAIAAAVAVIASAYPVVFLGGSFVSPNYGTALLYDQYPTLPGYSNTEEPTKNGSDMGPALWQHVPYGFIERRALAEGELPWWNRYNSAGTPLLAQAQSMFGDPLQLIVLAGNGAAWAWDVKYLVAKWLFAAGVGLCVLAIGRLRPGAGAVDGRYAIAAVLVAVAAPFIGFYVYRINHPAFFTESYAPWVLWCWLALAGAVRRTTSVRCLAALLLANFALLNSGTAKEASLLVLQMNLAGAIALFAHGQSWRERLTKLAGAAWVGLLLALVAAPLWLPFLQTLSHSFTSYTDPLAYQIQPALLLGAFDELFFRPLSRGEIVFNPSLNFGFLLGLAYFAATLRYQLAHRAAVALATVAACFALVIFGVISPLWIAKLPLLAHVAHIENCFLCGFIVLGAVLAGVGFATAAERLRTRDGWADLAIGGLLVAAIVAAWIGFWQASHRMVFGPGTTFTVVPPGEVLPVNAFIWGSLAALLTATVIAAAVARQAVARGRLGPAAAILLVGCALVLLWREGMHATSVGFPAYVVRPAVRANLQAKSEAVSFLQQRPEPARVFGTRGHLTPGWNAVYGLEAVHGPDALQNPWLRELLQAAPIEWGSIWRLYVFPKNIASARPVLDALNVRYYLDAAAHRSEMDPSLTRVLAADLDVYESPTAWPRAFFCDRVTTYGETAELVRAITASHGHAFAAVQRNDPATASLAAVTGNAPAANAIAADNYRLTANTTTFHVRASGPGVVVLTEAWWPGDFRAEINGRKAPVLRLNHAFKGVAVDRAGDYTVTFRYVPKHFTVILTLFLCGLALVAASLLIARGRRQA